MKKSIAFKFLLLGVGLVLVGLALYTDGDFQYFTGSNNDKEFVLFGNVDIRKVELSFRVSGRVEQMNVEEGDVIKKGELLASLNDLPYMDELRVAEAQLAQAKAELAKLEHGNRMEEIAQIKALVEQREASYNNAKRELLRHKTLYQNKVISKRSNDLAITTFEETQAQLDSAKEALRLSTAGFRVEDIAAGRAGVQLAEARLAQVETKLADTNLFSPSDGIILTRVTEPGAVLAAGQTAYTLSLYDPVWVRAYLEEPDLGRVPLGMKALVYTDSNPDKSYTGKVGFISPEAEFTPKTVQTENLRTDLVYRMRIIVDNPDDGLRQGMPVTVKLISQKK